MSMTTWTDGYVADVGYTFGYYPELNPLHAPLLLGHAGVHVPRFGQACELGFGQGLSVGLHVAASETHWCGTDFNPSQAAFAQALAAASGRGARLYDESFAEFCQRSDLPDFDYIGLHGIWSWINDDNRRVIVEFIRRKLKVGGLLYISYNTLPGWAAFAPLRHLMVAHAQAWGGDGAGTLARIDSALDFAQRLLATEPVYARTHPQMVQRIQQLKEQNRQYLAHEYFNRDWQPMHFADMADWLGPAKVQYACSAHALDHVNAIHLRPQQQAFVKEIPDPVLRETVRDFMVNQVFRRDYWIKGKRQMPQLERNETLRRMRVVLTTPREQVPMVVHGALGMAQLDGVVYPLLLDALADHQVYSLGELEALLKAHHVQLHDVVQAVLLLNGAGHVAAAQTEADTQACRTASDRINTYLMDRARSDNDTVYLACPVTGGGLPMGRIGQLFIRAIKEGLQQPFDWAECAWKIMQEQGQRLQMEGATLETDAENLTELNAQALEFGRTHLPVLKALQVI